MTQHINNIIISLTKMAKDARLSNNQTTIYLKKLRNLLQLI